MKRSKFWKIVWVSGVYVLLLIILYLVVLYKVEWEYKDLNTYLYFYECNGDLCTSTTKQSNYYSKVLCEDNVCPYITDIIDNNLILTREGVSWIYDYLDDEIVNDSYIDYRYIDNDIFVFTDNNDNEGIIDLEGNILVDAKYPYIDDYNNGFISYKTNNLYGIDTIDDSHHVNSEYEDIILINDELFAGMKDNLYHIYSYGNIDSENLDNYNFVYAYGDVIFVIQNKKIDILDINLDSTLLMKIDTFYEYKAEKERDSLDFYSDGENIYFKVFINEIDYTTYKYNVTSKKII